VLRRAIAEVKQRWSVSGVTKNLLSPAPPWFGRHVKPLVLVAVAPTGNGPTKWVMARSPFVLSIRTAYAPAVGTFKR
jgi:hypothetical protein